MFLSPISIFLICLDIYWKLLNFLEQEYACWGALGYNYRLYIRRSRIQGESGRIIDISLTSPKYYAHSSVSFCLFDLWALCNTCEHCIYCDCTRSPQQAYWEGFSYGCFKITWWCHLHIDTKIKLAAIFAFLLLQN